MTAAQEVAREAGWSQLSIEKLSQASKVSPEEIRRIFPSRAHVASGILERVLERLPAEIADEITPRSTLRDRLYTCVAHLLRTLEKDKTLFRSVSEDFVREPRIGALQIPLVAQYLDTVARQIEVCRNNGEISRFVIPHLAASAFWLIHLRIIRFWLTDSTAVSEKTHAFADKLITSFVRTLGAPSPTRAPSPPDRGLN